MKRVVVRVWAGRCQDQGQSRWPRPRLFSAPRSASRAHPTSIGPRAAPRPPAQPVRPARPAPARSTAGATNGAVGSGRAATHPRHAHSRRQAGAGSAASQPRPRWRRADAAAMSARRRLIGRAPRRRLHADRDAGGAADARDHVGARLRDLSRRRASPRSAPRSRSKRSREIEFGMRMLVMDFAQMVPRPVRDPLGQTRVPALHGFSGNGTSARCHGIGPFRQQLHPLSASQHRACTSIPIPDFNSSFGDSSSTKPSRSPSSRAPAGRTPPASSAARCSGCPTALVNDVLKRATPPALDTVQGTKPQVQDLFGGVKTVQLRYLDGNQTWQNQWPPPNLPLARGAVDPAGGRRDHHRVQGLGTGTPADRGRRMSADGAQRRQAAGRAARSGADHRAHSGRARRHPRHQVDLRRLARAAAHHRHHRGGAGVPLRHGRRSTRGGRAEPERAKRATHRPERAERRRSDTPDRQQSQREAAG